MSPEFGVTGGWASHAPARAVRYPAHPIRRLQVRTSSPTPNASNTRSAGPQRPSPVPAAVGLELLEPEEPESKLAERSNNRKGIPANKQARPSVKPAMPPPMMSTGRGAPVGCGGGETTGVVVEAAEGSGVDELKDRAAEEGATGAQVCTAAVAALQLSCDCSLMLAAALAALAHRCACCAALTFRTCASHMLGARNESGRADWKVCKHSSTQKEIVEK
jgi:hypothetical protein